MEKKSNEKENEDPPSHPISNLLAGKRQPSNINNNNINNSRDSFPPLFFRCRLVMPGCCRTLHKKKHKKNWQRYPSPPSPTIS